MEDLKTRYDLNFIPYRDGEEIVWAVYDASLQDQEHNKEANGTELLTKAVSNEIGDSKQHISKNRLEKLTEIYDAKILISSKDENSVHQLQNLLGEDNDVHDYLSKFGFTEGDLCGFQVKTEEEPTDKIAATAFERVNPIQTPEQPQEESKASTEAETQDSPEEEEPEAETPTARKFNSNVGSVPISDAQDWDDSDAVKLLYSALVFKQREIDENIKGSIKEGISDALAIATTATAATGYSTYATGSGLLAIGLMTYNAVKDSQDRDEILKDWSNYVRNRESPNVTREERFARLKEDMKNSRFAYEGVSEVPRKEYDKYKPFFVKMAELKGYTKDPKHTVDAQQAISVGDRVRNITESTSRKISLNWLNAKHTTSLAKDGVKEIGTDLCGLFNPRSGKRRDKIISSIIDAGKITTQDTRDWQKNKKAKKAEIERGNKTKAALKDIKEEVANEDVQTGPATIHSEIDLGEYIRHKEILQQIPQVRNDKKWAEINYANVTGSMAAQMAGIINGILTLNPIDVASNSYGLLTGIGAYAQTGSNVVNIDNKLHGNLVEEAEKHDYVKRMEQERVTRSYIEQHPEILEESHNDDSPQIG